MFYLFGCASCFLDDTHHFFDDAFAEIFRENRRFTENKFICFDHQLVFEILGKVAYDALLFLFVLFAELSLIVFYVNPNLLPELLVYVIFSHKTADNTHLLLHKIILHVNILQNFTWKQNKFKSTNPKNISCTKYSLDNYFTDHIHRICEDTARYQHDDDTQNNLTVRLRNYVSISNRNHCDRYKIKSL